MILLSVGDGSDVFEGDRDAAVELEVLPVEAAVNLHVSATEMY